MNDENAKAIAAYLANQTGHIMNLIAQVRCDISALTVAVIESVPVEKQDALRARVLQLQQQMANRLSEFPPPTSADIPGLSDGNKGSNA